MLNEPNVGDHFDTYIQFIQGPISTIFCSNLEPDRTYTGDSIIESRIEAQLVTASRLAITLTTYLH